jgi:hypothetical protein
MIVHFSGFAAAFAELQDGVAFGFDEGDNKHIGIKASRQGCVCGGRNWARTAKAGRSTAFRANTSESLSKRWAFVAEIWGKRVTSFVYPAGSPLMIFR